MEEEEEACRVCRGEATIKEPLFHPCKCSGSIRYVHQDCLMDWLSHSNKAYCELCNHYYKFTPIYKDGMPSTMPMSILVRHLKDKSYIVLKWTLRVCLVGFVWLLIVPLITVWMWRFYFWNANTLFYYLNTWILHTPKLNFYMNNEKKIPVTSLLKNVLYDCLEGWLIAFIFTLTVVAGFLLREWILQNVPAELHDNDLEQELVQEQPAIEIQPTQIDRIDNTVLDRRLTQSIQAQNTQEDHLLRTQNIERFDVVGESSSGSRRRRKKAYNRSLLESEDYENLEAMWKPDRDLHVDGKTLEEALIDSLPTDNDSVFDYGNGYQHRVQEEAHVEITQQSGQEEIQNQPAVDELLQQENDEMRGAEDITGILEAIGIKGSLYILFQNSALMSLLMFLLLGGGVWIPYIVGALFIATQPWRCVTFVCQDLYETINLVTDYVVNRYLRSYDRMKGPDVVVKLLRGFFHCNALAEAPMTYYPVPLWKQVLSVWRLIISLVFQAYHDVPTGRRVIDRVVCITTGYILLVIGGSLYLARSQPIYARIGRTARKIIRQLGLFLKVSLFIWIEVVFFPIGCGLLLDLVALSMFYETSGEGHLIAIHKRMLFLKENVLSSIFIHWIVGTTCIFILTSMVSFCRDNVRPGVLWFMRDPNNEDHDPLKELVERSVASQLQKTVASSLLYGFVIEFGIGGLIFMTGILFKDIFPLKWSYSQPFMTLPIDLLIVMFVIPCSIEYVQPKQVLRNLIVEWINWLCHRLRLTSFLLGIRPSAGEEGVWTKIKIPEQAPDGFQLARLFTFLPKNIEIVQQDDEDEQVIYIPPYFQIRIMLFCLFMWMFWSALLCYLFVGPLSIGRFILSRYTEKRIHDVYSYFIGLSVLLSICILIKQMKSNQVKHILNWTFNLVIIVLCFGAIIPILFGFLLEFYVIIPCRQSTQAPNIHFFQLWINGVVCFYLFQTLLPSQSSLKQAFSRLLGNGIQGFKIKREIKELIGPIVLITMTANFLPFFLVREIVDEDKQIRALQLVYPCSIGIFILYYIVKLAIILCKKWTQSIRDDYYLIGKVLHNNN